MTKLLTMLSELRKYRKAIAAAVVAFVFGILTKSDGGLTVDDWLWILGQTLAAGGLTYLIPNKKD